MAKKKKKKIAGLKEIRVKLDIAREIKCRSRIFFSRQINAGYVIKSKKYKPVKHRLRQERSWSEE